MRNAIAAVVVLLVAALPATAQIPRQLAYQGILTDTTGTPRPDGSYTMVFSLYDVPTGGSLLWTESKSVTVKSGLFTTYLGDVTPFPGTITWSIPYWVGIKIGADPEMTPRVRLASSPYSLNPGGGNSQWYDTAGVLTHNGIVLLGRTNRVSTSEVFGVRYDGGAREYGGMYIETSNAQGWPFYGYATNGAFRAWTYFDGDSSRWRLYLSGIRLTVPSTGGLRIGPSTDYSLFIEPQTGSDGIRTNRTGDDAFQAGTTGEFSNYGVYIPSPGVTFYGLWPNTANASGEWALYTVDNIEAGNVVANAYAIVARVTGPDALQEGDIVAAVGMGEPIPGSQSSLSLVRRADDNAFTGIVGVVKSRMVWEVAVGKEDEGAMSTHSVEGPAQPGDLVSLIIAGVTNVRIDRATSVTAGQRLTAGSSAGAARPLQSRQIDGMKVTEGAQVVGIALAPSSGSGLIPVHVTLR